MTAITNALPQELFGAHAIEPVVDLLNTRHNGLDLDAERILLGPDRHGPLSTELDTPGDEPISVNGRCRLLHATDGWVAVQLAREQDEQSVAAIVETSVQSPWVALRNLAARTPSAEFVERVRLLDVPTAQLGEIDTTHPVVVVHRRKSDMAPRSPTGPVADLSSMWAGPLCAKIFGGATGRRVIDVESALRPDPLREAGDSFARHLHGGRILRVFDHTTGDGLKTLEQILSEASVVVTSGRDRALRSLAVDPLSWVERHGGIWIHISGYGLTGPLANAPAFGDDAAAAGGLVGGTPSAPSFLHDAVADPLTGLLASLVALTTLDDEGTASGCFIDVSMSAAAALIAGNGKPDTAEPVVER